MTVFLKISKNAQRNKVFSQLRIANASQSQYQNIGGNMNVSIIFIILISLCSMIFILASRFYYSDYNNKKSELVYPPRLTDIPEWWYKRAETRINEVKAKKLFSHDFQVLKNNVSRTIQSFPENNLVNKKKLVCYYAFPDFAKNVDGLHLKNIDPNLCTHINIGIVDIVNYELNVTEEIHSIFKEAKCLRRQNPDLKFLIWTGGFESNSFIDMVRNHANRKVFIRSLKHVLANYSLNGIDLDWEFPSPFHKERQHFSQLLQEIRREYRREKRNYLLTIAAAAPEGIAYYAYDIKEINKYVDFVNIMTYDYHFYSSSTPFTGLNAPLYSRHNEHSILGTLNINYSAHYWHLNGLDKNKIVVGLPTYGHSFRLVNPFNNDIMSPSNGFGNVGKQGFASYSEICWFRQNNFYVTTVFNKETCSPYLYTGLEWISFENEESLRCKSLFIKENDFGGAMLFSLNTDDFRLYCDVKGINNDCDGPSPFPLIRTVRSILFNGA